MALSTFCALLFFFLVISVPNTCSAAPKPPKGPKGPPPPSPTPPPSPSQSGVNQSMGFIIAACAAVKNESADAQKCPAYASCLEAFLPRFSDIGTKYLNLLTVSVTLSVEHLKGYASNFTALSTERRNSKTQKRIAQNCAKETRDSTTSLNSAAVLTKQLVDPVSQPNRNKLTAFVAKALASADVCLNSVTQAKAGEDITQAFLDAALEYAKGVKNSVFVVSVFNTLMK